MGQHDESGKKEQVVYYLSKKFMAYEMNYSLLEKTCYALVWAAPRLRQYMLNYTTCFLSKMDPVVTQKVIKGSALADYLAQQSINDYQPMHSEFPDEDIMTLFEEEVEDEDRDKWIVWYIFPRTNNIYLSRLGCASTAQTT